MAVVLFSVTVGLIVGSGLSALIPRMAAGEPWTRGRSHCPRCRHVLSPRDLVPVLSYLWNRGRCRYCRGAVGWFYPTVELATAALFVASLLLRTSGDVSLEAASDHRLWLAVFRDWFAISALIALFGIDLIAQVLPDAVTLPGIAVLSVWNLALGGDVRSLVIGVSVGAAFFLAQYIVSRGAWIGGGDIRMGALLGALVGWPGILLTLFVSYFFGALVGVMLIAAGRKTWKSRVPFGTFLAAGGVFTMFWGGRVIRWYLGMIM